MWALLTYRIQEIDVPWHSQSFLNNFTILLSLYISNFKKCILKKSFLTYKVTLHKKGIDVEIGGKRDTFIEIEEKRETS